MNTWLMVPASQVWARRQSVRLRLRLKGLFLWMNNLNVYKINSSLDTGLWLPGIQLSCAKRKKNDITAKVDLILTGIILHNILNLRKKPHWLRDFPLLLLHTFFKRQERFRCSLPSWKKIVLCCEFSTCGWCRMWHAKESMNTLLKTAR